jgi:acetyl esterase
MLQCCHPATTRSFPLQQSEESTNFELSPGDATDTRKVHLMPLDAAAAGLLAQIEALGLPQLNELSPPEAREAAAGFIELAGPPEAVDDITNRTIPGPGGEVPVRIYTPSGADSPAPCLVYIHGGGWVIGTLDTTDTICTMVANRAGCKVVSVDYRLSPEHKFPAPFDDCAAAVAWVHENAAELGVDPNRIAVGGDSAGGNLATAIALKAKADGGPPICYQLLIYPVTNHGFDTASYKENGEGYLLTEAMMRWFWDHYLNSEGEGANPLASPLLAEDLSGLPPAMVVTAEFDPLRDEGEAYVARLEAAGVPVEHTRYDGQIHAFWQMPAVFPAAHQAADAAGVALRKAFSA